MLPSHPALSEPHGFSWGKLTFDVYVNVNLQKAVWLRAGKPHAHCTYNHLESCSTSKGTVLQWQGSRDLKQPQWYCHKTKVARPMKFLILSHKNLSELLAQYSPWNHNYNYDGLWEKTESQTLTQQSYFPLNVNIVHVFFFFFFHICPQSTFLTIADARGIWKEKKKNYGQKKKTEWKFGCFTLTMKVGVKGRDMDCSWGGGGERRHSSPSFPMSVGKKKKCQWFVWQVYCLSVSSSCYFLPWTLCPNAGFQNSMLMTVLWVVLNCCYKSTKESGKTWIERLTKIHENW